MAKKKNRADRTLINDLVDALEKKLGKPSRAATRPLLPAIVKAVLSVDASPQKVESAYAKLEKEFVDWNEVRVTAPRELAECIKGVGDELAKAEAITALLGKVFADRNELYFDFLSDMQDETRIAYLETIQGLDRLYQQALLVYGLGHSALLVGHGALRVLKRVGVVSKQTDGEAAFESLSGVIAKRRLLPFSVLTAEVAATFCHLRSPECKECPVRVLCVNAKTSSRSR